MGDTKTIIAYNKGAISYAKEWQDQPVPADMYELLLKYFKAGVTADIGCGSGRDAAWLSKNGFEVSGFDVSQGLLSEARKLHPGILFRWSSLPELKEITSGSFQNVLCETVIMHLELSQIPLAVKRLRDILCKGGIMYLSWRVTVQQPERDAAGRLYSTFEKELILSQFKNTDLILFDQESTSASSGKKIHRLVIQRG